MPDEAKERVLATIRALAAVGDFSNVYINTDLGLTPKTWGEKLVRRMNLGPTNEDPAAVVAAWKALVKQVRVQDLSRKDFLSFVRVNDSMKRLAVKADELKEVDSLIVAEEKRLQEEAALKKMQEEEKVLQAFEDQIRKHPACEGNYWKDLKGYPAGTYHIYTVPREDHSFCIRYLAVKDDIVMERLIIVRISKLGFAARGVSLDNLHVTEGGYTVFQELLEKLKTLEPLAFAVASPEALQGKERIAAFRQALEADPLYCPEDAVVPPYPPSGYRIGPGEGNALVDQYHVEFLSKNAAGGYFVARTPFLMTPEGYHVFGKGPYATMQAATQGIEEGVASRNGGVVYKGKDAAVDAMAHLAEVRWHEARSENIVKFLETTKLPLASIMEGRADIYPEHWLAFEEMSETLFAQYDGLPRRGHPFARSPDLSGRDRDELVTPYDYNRIGVYDTTEYINASNVVLEGQRYIIAQAPLMKTRKDFLNMTVREGISFVVNLALEAESADYWSDKACPIRLDGDFVIQCGGEQEVGVQGAARVVKRTLRLMKGNREERLITQYHYLGWPKGGVPDVELILQLLKQIPKTRCLLVHGSLGTGRTGTFVCLHHLINVIQAKGKVKDLIINPQETILRMRVQRPGQVENIAQLEFITQALRAYHG